MTIGEAVQKNAVAVGDRIYTQPEGRWPGGPCTVVRVGPDQPDAAPEIVLYVRHDDPEVRAREGEVMGCYEWEAFAFIESSLVRDGDDHV